MIARYFYALIDEGLNPLIAWQAVAEKFPSEHVTLNALSDIAVRLLGEHWYRQDPSHKEGLH